jgi:AraC-like DNA-binding protein
MPEPVCETFSDPDEAAAAIRSTNVEFAVLAPACSEWRVGEVALAESSLWWGKLGARSSSLGTMPADTSWFVMSGCDARGWTLNRHSLGESDIGFMQSGTEYGCSYPVPGSWMALAFPRAWLDRQVGFFLPEGFDFGKGVATFDVGTGAARVRHAFDVAASFAARNGALMQMSETRASLQRALISAVLHSIEPKTGGSERKDARLLSKVLQYLHAYPRAAICQHDLCRALSTNTRALRRLFPEAFGTTPGKYLRVRRLHLARRSLLSGKYASVTAAAVHYGFFDLGRFASSYRTLFGEMPSHTLARISSGKAPGPGNFAALRRRAPW